MVDMVKKQQMVDWIAAGEKPKDRWLIGTEHEKFLFNREDLRPLDYEGKGGIGEVLGEFERRYDWQPVREDGKVIALFKDGGSITLEPGGQLELSGAPLRHIGETCSEISTHLVECRAISDDLGFSMLAMGFNPKWGREDMVWMPKGRYGIMREYMPKVGNLGIDMMQRSCTVQVNLDFADEADMVKKMRVSLALQPIATALFAASPFLCGKVSGYQSYRSHVWTDTDAARTGDLPFVFEDGFGYERYVEYMLDVPMYLIHRDGEYIDAAGLDYKDFIKGKLSVLPNEFPTALDWELHLSTAFPEVRLKRFLEMRGADAGPHDMLCALSAFWVGLLYDEQALDAAWYLVKGWDDEKRAGLRRDVPKTGIHTRFGKGDLADFAGEVLAICESGLKARSVFCGHDERVYLHILKDIVENKMSLSDRILKQFEGEWGGEIEPLYDVLQY